MAFFVPLAGRLPTSHRALRSWCPSPSTGFPNCSHPALRRAQATMASAVPAGTDGMLINDVYQFWFGSLQLPRYTTLQSQNKLWYDMSKEVDDEIRTKFGKQVEMALDGKLDHLIGSKQYPIRADLILVILLDQFSRNIFRGDAKAFAGDAKSREIVMDILKPERWSAAKQVLPPAVQASFLLPLMHQESLQDIDLCATKVADLVDDCKKAGDEAADCADTLSKMISYAEKHREIIAKFGRYPYRNDALGRESSQQEREFLENGPRFGQ